MAIGTYSELQTAVANWLARSDLTARIPEFIALAEADLKRRLAVADTETRDTLTTTDDNAYVALPADFKRIRGLALATTPPHPLTFVAPAQMDVWAIDDATGEPQYYTVIGSSLRLWRTPDSAYTLNLDYIATLAALSDAAPTNWLLTDHPDAYLFGALTMAEGYLKNDPRIATWKAQYEAVVEGIEKADREDRWGGPLEMRPDPRYVA